MSVHNVYNMPIHSLDPSSQDWYSEHPMDPQTPESDAEVAEGRSYNTDAEHDPIPPESPADDAELAEGRSDDADAWYYLIAPESLEHDPEDAEGRYDNADADADANAWENLNELNPHAGCACANHDCCFAVHSDVVMGGFCCKRCCALWMHAGKTRRKHGVLCGRIRAPPEVKRAPPVLPFAYAEVPGGRSDNDNAEYDQRYDAEVPEGRSDNANAEYDPRYDAEVAEGRSDNADADANANADAAPERNPHEGLACANLWCDFAVQSDVSMGGFCCSICCVNWMNDGKAHRKHGLRCEKNWAPLGAMRAPPVPPRDTRPASVGEPEQEGSMVADVTHTGAPAEGDTQLADAMSYEEEEMFGLELEEEGQGTGSAALSSAAPPLRLFPQAKWGLCKRQKCVQGTGSAASSSAAPPLRLSPQAKWGLRKRQKCD